MSLDGDNLLNDILMEVKVMSIIVIGQIIFFLALKDSKYFFVREIWDSFLSVI